MKVTFIFAFVLLCGLAYCEENNNNFEDETAELEDPKILRPRCYRKCGNAYVCRTFYRYVPRCRVIRKCSFKPYRVPVCSRKCYYVHGRRVCKNACRSVIRRRNVCGRVRVCSRVKRAYRKCKSVYRCRRICRKH